MVLGNSGTNETVGRTTERTAPAIAWALTVSMAGIVIVSLLYIVSPVDLVAPIVPLDVMAARAGAVSAGTATHWIAPFGMAADPVAAAASIALAWRSLRRDRSEQALGWLLVGLSSLLFVIIDTTAGAVLAPLGRLPGDGFAGVKLLFDDLFVAGTICLAIGQLCLTVPAIALSCRRATWLHWALAIDGVLGLVSAYALLFGHDWALLLGLSVGIAAVLFTVVGARMLAENVHADF